MEAGHVRGSRRILLNLTVTDGASAQGVLSPALGTPRCCAAVVSSHSDSIVDGGCSPPKRMTGAS